jgi:uncharacterized protein
VLRNADAIVYCQATTAPSDELAVVLEEVGAAGIALPALLAATKSDDAGPEAVERVACAFPELEVVAFSVLDDESLDRLCEAIWRLTGLVRVFLRRGHEVDDEPVALHPGATVEDAADEIHHELAERFSAARVWGPSARFDGQRVGRSHVVLDGDVVEIVR